MTTTTPEVCFLPSGLDDAIYNEAIALCDKHGYGVFSDREATPPCLGDIVIHLGQLAIVSAILTGGVVQLYSRSVDPDFTVHRHFFAAASELRHVCLPPLSGSFSIAGHARMKGA